MASDSPNGWGCLGMTLSPNAHGWLSSHAGTISANDNVVTVNMRPFVRSAGSPSSTETPAPASPAYTNARTKFPPWEDTT